MKFLSRLRKQKSLSHKALTPDIERFMHGDRSAQFEQIMIVGKADFIAETICTLRLIKGQAPSEYEIILKHLGMIREWFQSGVSVEALPPCFFVSRKVAFASRT
ncbi:MAG: hypothetical protein KDD62_12820, partial [Bdellovibrionales bacterium]|nr:hypothetical protein [Bdellovibrionales bacterium]